MPTLLKGKVARTVSDRTHVNRLAVPQFGIVELRLKNGDDSKQSKAVLPEGNTQPAGGTNDFHFAPEKETIKICYEISDPFAIITKAKLELFTRFSEKPLWTLDLTKLGPTWYAHGKHVVQWDGRLPKADAEKSDTESDGAYQHDLKLLDPEVVPDVFPDGYVTLEHTPYKLKLTVASDRLKGKPAFAWTYCQILIKSIELELGPETIIPTDGVPASQQDGDKAVRTAIEADGGLPKSDTAPVQTREVYLVSNLYKQASGSEMDDNTAFTQYFALWGDGPQIPIIAKIRLADSKDAEVKLESEPGAVALGNVKFLWDWQDPEEDVDGRQAGKPKDFLKAAIDYYKDGTDDTRTDKDHTYPKGDNCHVDRGGKRGPDAPAIFPKQDGYDAKDPLDEGKFPFKVKACKTRKWAAFSQGWAKGALKGHTGVVFQPSRMAGDDYTVTVYLAYDKAWDADEKKAKVALDIVDEPLKVAEALKKATGKFQVWREIHVSRYIRKQNSIGNFVTANLASIRAAYDKAYVRVNNIMQADDSYVMSEHRNTGGAATDYNQICEDALQATGNDVLTQHLAVSATADHAAEDSMFKVRPYAEFVQKLHDAVNGAGTAATDFAGWNLDGSPVSANAVAEWLGTGNLTRLTGPPAADKKTRLMATQNWLNSNGVDTQAGYSNQLTYWLPYEPVVNGLETLRGGKAGVKIAAKDGLTIVQFNCLHTLVRDLVAAGTGGVEMLQGVAMDSSDATRNCCVFLFFQVDLGTFLHEVGHHLFLPHSRHHVGNTISPAGAQDDKHDDDDQDCLMSYSDGCTDFCGLCQLRLRGWDDGPHPGVPPPHPYKLSKNDADNKKP